MIPYIGLPITPEPCAYVAIRAHHHGVDIKTTRQPAYRTTTMSIQESSTERANQTALLGTANDDHWTPGELAGVISHFATRSVYGDLGAVDLDKFRQDMVKVGALALAAIESLDRRSAK